MTVEVGAGGTMSINANRVSIAVAPVEIAGRGRDAFMHQHLLTPVRASFVNLRDGYWQGRLHTTRAERADTSAGKQSCGLKPYSLGWSLRSLPLPSHRAFSLEAL